MMVMSRNIDPRDIAIEKQFKFTLEAMALMRRPQPAGKPVLESLEGCEVSPYYSQMFKH
jgi:hypothetical protein